MRQSWGRFQVAEGLPDIPTLWIVAGANGSGKSSAYSASALDETAGSIWIINPDELSKTIAEQEDLPLTPDANLEAVRRIETWLYASVAAHQTVGVETVLSTDKYRRLVDHAHAHGFAVRLIYVFLKSADLNVERVRIRVSKGGHDVEEARIRDRRQRSFEQLGWFIGAADRVDIYDNSAAEPSLVFVKQGEDAAVYGPLIEEVARAIQAWSPGLLLTTQAGADGGTTGGRPVRRRRRRRRRRRTGKATRGAERSA